MIVGHMQMYFLFYSYLCSILVCFLHVLIGVCAYTHYPDRLYQQCSAGLYLEWHLEGRCDGSVYVYAFTSSLGACFFF